MKTLIIILVIALLVLGLWWFLKAPQGPVSVPVSRSQGSSLPSKVEPSKVEPVPPPPSTPQNSSTTPTKTPALLTTSTPKPPATTSSSTNPVSAGQAPKTFDIAASFTAAGDMFGDETATTVLSATLVPKELLGKTVNGIELRFAAQSLPRVWGTYLVGYLDEGDWQCLVSEDEKSYICEGATALRLNQNALIKFHFRSEELSLAQVPSQLSLRLLNNGILVTTVSATKK